MLPSTAEPISFGVPLAAMEAFERKGPSSRRQTPVGNRRRWEQKPVIPIRGRKLQTRSGGSSPLFAIELRPEVPFLQFCALVLGMCQTHGFLLRDLGDGNVPPRIVSWHAIVIIGFHDDDGGSIVLPSLLEGGLQLVGRLDRHGTGAQAQGVGGKIYW